MSNVTTTTNETNLSALLSNAKFVECIRLNEVKNLTNEFNVNQKIGLQTSVKIAQKIGIAIEFIKTDESKDMAKECNVKLTNEVMANIFGYSLPQFNRYKAVAKLESEVINNYLATSEEKSLIGLLKFSNAEKCISEDTNEESEENESEGTIKIEPLQIKVGKDNKISIKGKASKEVLTLLIEELKKMMA
jgi:hypothetical protein